MSAHAVAHRMLPAPKPKPARKNTGIELSTSLLEKLEDIRSQYGVKSRNQLIESMLSFDVELFPHIQRLKEKIAEVEVEAGVNQAQAIVKLVEQGLLARKRKNH